MRNILCFTDKPCPHREEFMGFHEEMSGSIRHPYYKCGAKSLEQMRPCILGEDKDIKDHGFKVLVKEDGKVKAWDPKQVLIQRHDREQQIDGQEAIEV